MEDEKILDLYWERNETAITETDHKYGSYCYSISYRILSNHLDSEECVNDTWLKAWNTVPPNRPQHLKLFLAKIVRNLSFDRYKAKNVQKRKTEGFHVILDELEDCIIAPSDVETEIECRELSKAISVFLQNLTQKERQIFLLRYFTVESMEEISKHCGIKEKTIFVILSRTRKKLKKYLLKEGFYL